MLPNQIFAQLTHFSLKPTALLELAANRADSETKHEKKNELK